MQRILKNVSSLMMAAVLGVSLAACVGPPASHWAKQANQKCPFEPDESVTTHVVLAYQVIPNGDAVVQGQHMLETCMPNASIEWKRFDSAGEILQAYGSNSIDYGLLGSAALARGLSQPLNLSLKTPWVFDEIGTAESLVVKDPNVKKIQDLKGKNIAVTFSSTSHYSLLGALKQAGMVVGKDVKLINLSPDRMLAGWQSDQIDAAWVWDPTLSKLTENGHVITSSKEAAEAGAPTYDLATFTSDFVQKNPEFMRVWARAQNAAALEIRNNPEEAASSMALLLGLEPKMIVQQIKGYSYPVASQQVAPQLLGRDLGTVLFDTANFLLENREIQATNPPQVYKDAPDASAARSVEGK